MLTLYITCCANEIIKCRTLAKKNSDLKFKFPKNVKALILVCTQQICQRNFSCVGFPIRINENS